VEVMRVVGGVLLAAAVVSGCAPRLSEQEARAKLQGYGVHVVEGPSESFRAGRIVPLHVVHLDLRPGYAAAILGDAMPPTSFVALVVLVPDDAAKHGWSMAKSMTFSIELRTLKAFAQLASLSRPTRSPARAGSESAWTKRWWEAYVAREGLGYPDAERAMAETFFITPP
jgi:hypothetical protein